MPERAGRRLAAEKSPYLLAHARNPVDWHPWGAAAFAAARERDVPVLVSIGYHACHWCHVMERESFEDEGVARLMNEGFVCVKVDREELPAVDHLYMAYTQGMTGGGGWPMTVFATPSGLPFFAGTYFPRESGFGRPGMLELLPRLGELWRDHRAEVLATAARLRDTLGAQLSVPGGGTPPGEALAREAYEQLAGLHDPRWGGFGRAPKFPTVPWLLFLMRYAPRGGDGRARAMAEEALRAMRLGGIHDHLGFGFHRYSTDERWLVPHFEKMLVDQALLAIAYAEGWRRWGDPAFRRTALETVEYVLRDLRAPDGGFATAEDADSEGEEGRYYLWTTDEIVAELGPGAAADFLTAFHAKPNGNFRAEHGAWDGRNILHRTSPLALAASDFTLPDGLDPGLEASRAKLLAARGRRPRPARDDKVLADGNGLMIAALARCAAACGKPGLAGEAAAAADFVLGRLRSPGGGLLHRYRDGDAAHPATLDDHAFLAWGCLELHGATGEARWLDEARALADAMLAGLRDPAGGGLFFAPEDPLLPLRQKIAADAAIPSGNAVAVEVLVGLARAGAGERYRDEARAILAGLSADVERSPLGCAGLISAAMLLEEA